MFIGVLRSRKELTTEDTVEISHKGHGGGFIYGKGMELKMWRRNMFYPYIVHFVQNLCDLCGKRN